MLGTVYRAYSILPFGIVSCTFFPTTFLEIAVCETSVIGFCEIYNSNFLSFPPSSVMTLLAFHYCFLSSVLRQDTNSFYSIKANCCGFELSPVCINFIMWPRSSLIIELWHCTLLSVTTDSFRVLHAVDSLNVKHELWFKSKAILYHVDISGRCQSLFASWKSCCNFCMN